MSVSIGELITAKMPRTGTLRASSWRAYDVEGERHIYHYNALMAVVSDRKVTQVGSGWGSMTDKCGMARIRKGASKAGYEFASEVN